MGPGGPGGPPQYGRAMATHVRSRPRSGPGAGPPHPSSLQAGNHARPPPGQYPRQAGPQAPINPFLTHPARPSASRSSAVPWPCLAEGPRRVPAGYGQQRGGPPQKRQSLFRRSMAMLTGNNAGPAPSSVGRRCPCPHRRALPPHRASRACRTTLKSRTTRASRSSSAPAARVPSGTPTAKVPSSGAASPWLRRPPARTRSRTAAAPGWRPWRAAGASSSSWASLRS